MLRSRRQIGETEAYLLVRRTLKPGLVRELRDDTRVEAVRKRLFGKKAVEQANRAKLLEGSRQNIMDMLRALQKADPELLSGPAWAYSEPVRLDYGKTSEVDVRAQTSLRHIEDTDILDIHLEGSGQGGQDIDARQELRVVDGGDILIPTTSKAIFNEQCQPIEDMLAGPSLVEFYDLTGRVANAMSLAQEAGTLAVHGPTESVARLQG